MRVRFSPLGQQFAEPDEIFDELRALVRSGDFTLGKVVGEFEAAFAGAVGMRHAIGVGSGTDALKIPLAQLASSKAKVRSALNRAGHQSGHTIKTSSDEKFLYVWRE